MDTLKLVLFLITHVNRWIGGENCLCTEDQVCFLLLAMFKFKSSLNIIVHQMSVMSTDVLPFFKLDGDQLFTHTHRQASKQAPSTLVYPSSQEGWLDYPRFYNL